MKSKTVIIVILATLCCLNSPILGWRMHPPSPHNGCHNGRTQQEQPNLPSKSSDYPRKYLSDSLFNNPFYYLDSLHDIVGSSWDPWYPFWTMYKHLPNDIGCSGIQNRGISVDAASEKIPYEADLKADLNNWEVKKLEEWDQQYKEQQEQWERNKQTLRERFVQELKQKTRDSLKEKRMRQLQVEREAADKLKQQNLEKEAALRYQKNRQEHSPERYSQRVGQAKRMEAKVTENQRPHTKPTEIVTIHVPGYRTSELDMAVKGYEVTVKGHHKCSCDEMCLVSQFERKYHLPRNIDPSTVTATLSEDGALQIMGHSYRHHNAHKIHSVERSIAVQGGVSSETVTEEPKCGSNTGNPGISLAKRNTHTGKVFIPTASDIRDHQGDSYRTADDHGDNDDDVTIEVVPYDG